MKAKLFFALVAATFSACTAGTTIIPDDGWFEMRGDERGIQAMGDVFTGLVTTGKASPDKETAHHLLRKEQVRTLSPLERLKAAKGGSYAGK